MAIDRENSLRRAEKLLRQGRLDGAIEEYERLVEDQPRDWNTRNLLGDLYVRAGQIEQAVEQFTRIADHFAEEGFLPRAIALYKKVVKIKPDDEHSLLQSAEIAAKQGLLVDAKACLSSIAEQRRRRGDRTGANEVLLRIGALDPTDFAARANAARAIADAGDRQTAARCFKEIASDLFAKDRAREALDWLVEAIRLDPSDGSSRDRLVRAHLQQGDLESARACAATSVHAGAVADELLARGRDDDAAAMLSEALAREPADTSLRSRLVRLLIVRGDLEEAGAILPPDIVGHDATLLLLAAEVSLCSGRIEQGRAQLRAVVEGGPDSQENLVLLGCSLADANAEAAFECIDVAASAAIVDRDWPAAAAVLQEFLRRVPGHMGALIKLVDVCVDGDLEDSLLSAQSDLADCYLAAGRPAEASVIAEDLVIRTRGDAASVGRFRRALEMLGEPQPDAIIADRVSAARSTADGFDLEDGASSPLDLPDFPSHGGTASSEDTPADEEAQPVQAEGGASGSPSHLSDGSDDHPADDQASDIVELDLTSALAELKAGGVPGPQPRGSVVGGDLDGVFEEFRNEVLKEETASAAGQSYKLALAYLDLGMAEESVKALETAVRASRYRFQAASLLGHIHRRQGRTEEAIEWFERAAETPASSAEAARALLYELGQTLEDAGESVRALAVYLELQADAGDYRDVRERIARLSHPETGG